METRTELTVPKWPFFLADALLILCAVLIYFFGEPDRGAGHGALIVFFLFLGAVAVLIPYIVEFCWQWQQAVPNRSEDLEQQQMVLDQLQQKVASLLKGLEKQTIKSDRPRDSSCGTEQIQESLQEIRESQTIQAEQIREISEEMGNLREMFAKNRLSEVGELSKLVDRLKTLENGSFHSRDGIEPDEAPEIRIARETLSAAEQVAEEEQVQTSPSVAVTDDLIFDEEQPTDPAPPKPSKPVKPKIRQETGDSLFATATVVATSFIGAANRLYLRGNAAGLNWDKGVPMQFVEIGKWSWTTADAQGPIELQIFKNDEEPDRTGVLVLEPGQTLSIRPDFDG